ncbi:MAG TPA: flavodoxin domain-containing protein [Ferruginibacter sp.]|nr:flavodoxin domain-containing protein [Ferruginibacter sp.]
MLEQNKFTALLNLINTSTSEEIAWMNGYLNEIVSQQSNTQPVTKNKINKITIAYGTETGNSKKLATSFAASAKKQGIHAKVQSLEQYRLTDLSKEEYFLAVISTHGDGEPPAAARKFYDHVHQNGFRLENLKYSVLALGDTSYPLFCKAGEDVDTQLSKLGASRIAPLQKCDIDFDEESGEWFENIFKSFSTENTGTQTAAPAIRKKTRGKKIYSGKVHAHIDLNDIGSAKETFHIEITAEEVNYQPGDSIGVVPANNVFAVKEIIEFSGMDQSSSFYYKEELFTLFELLHKKLGITYLPERVVRQYASIVNKEITGKPDLIDLLKYYPLETPSDFSAVIKILEPITPRLYSIASSPEAHPGEVHITVAKNYFQAGNETRVGLASGFLSNFDPGNEIEFYVHPNNQFRLPEEDKNIIMIGPGTGIAPFRAFLNERDVTGATGKNWLFFGDQHFTTDFLYQLEIQTWFETGLLTKVNTAFSRDQEKKMYVQHKMLRHGAEIFEWLNTGSYVYVCGSKVPMSIDVEQTIVQIIEKFGAISKDEAAQYLDELKDEGRYVKDVY